MTLKSSKGFCSFKEPFFPAFYQSESLAVCWAKGGRFPMISIKDKAGRLLFMALTLIVQGSSIPSLPSFPSICCGCNNASCTWWEGEILIYSWSFQVSLSAFQILFDRRKTKHGSQWGISRCSATKSDPGDLRGRGGRAPATPYPLPGVALALQEPHRPSKFNGYFPLPGS